MAKKQVPADRTRNQKTPKTKEKNPAPLAANSKNKSRNKGSKAAAGDGNVVLAVPSPRKGLENNAVAEFCEAAEDRVGDKEEKKKPKGKGEQKKKPKSKSGKETSGEEEAKSKGKKRSKKEEDDVESDVEEKSDNALYRFPMNRVSRIIRSENQDYRISQEAVFLINKASEKFLQVFCKEAYACAFLEDKRYTAYNHLCTSTYSYFSVWSISIFRAMNHWQIMIHFLLKSALRTTSAVAKQTRFGFLSDFVPEKVKAEDALAQVPAADK
ncbi:DNA polymerase epsilon subunit [Striga asiatica]|uniref:DNA polymerase epsilon subunit n=1 Tax=Striga asiatica TaxID=4170 RepID=A0A5A7RC24_STRAF|nr:DNA polymerase epsilon subunit [Striga asiatica]